MTQSLLFSFPDDDNQKGFDLASYRYIFRYSWEIRFSLAQLRFFTEIFRIGFVQVRLLTDDFVLLLSLV